MAFVTLAMSTFGTSVEEATTIGTAPQQQLVREEGPACRREWAPEARSSVPDGARILACVSFRTPNAPFNTLLQLRA